MCNGQLSDSVSSYFFTKVRVGNSIKFVFRGIFQKAMFKYDVTYFSIDDAAHAH